MPTNLKSLFQNYCSHGNYGNLEQTWTTTTKKSCPRQSVLDPWRYRAHLIASPRGTEYNYSLFCVTNFCGLDFCISIGVFTINCHNFNEVWSDLVVEYENSPGAADCLCVQMCNAFRGEADSGWEQNDLLLFPVHDKSTIIHSWWKWKTHPEKPFCISYFSSLSFRLWWVN